MISAQGVPARIITLWEEGAVEVAMLPATWDELWRVVEYPGLQRFLDPEVVERLLRGLKAHVVWVEPVAAIATIDRDLSDSRYLECAVAASASFLITGDEPLLALGSYAGIQIVTPAGFVAVERLWRDADRPN